YMEWIFALIGGLIVGALIAYIFTKKNISNQNEILLEEAKKKADEIEQIAIKNKLKSENLLKNAESEGERIKKEKILQAKEKFLELKSQHEESISQKERKTEERDKRSKEKEHKLNDGLSELKRKRKALDIEIQN